MNKTDKMEHERGVIDRYEELYFRRNGKPITVHSFKNGWYTLLTEGQSPEHTVQRHRLTEIAEMANRQEKTVAEMETAAKRTGYVVIIIPPRSATYRNMTNRYLTEDDGWFHNKTDPCVKVFESARDADERAHELNGTLPFKYAIIEPF